MHPDLIPAKNNPLRRSKTACCQNWCHLKDMEISLTSYNTVSFNACAVLSDVPPLSLTTFRAARPRR